MLPTMVFACRESRAWWFLLPAGTVTATAGLRLPLGLELKDVEYVA